MIEPDEPKRNKYNIIIRNLIVLLFLVTIIIIFSITVDGFFSLQSFNLILRQVSVLGILSVGLTLVILSGGIDLSVGALLALSVNLGGLGIKTGFHAIPVFLIIIFVGIILGFLNGFIVNSFQVPAIIVTLATMNIFRGITIIVTNSAWVSPLPNSVTFLGKGPVPLIIFLFIIILFTFIERKTKFGRNIFAIGGNTQAAVYSGVPLKKYTIIIYGICGLLSAVAGIVFMGRTGNIQPQVGVGWEMNAIAAIVVGGTSIWGGSGSVLRTLLGTVLMGVILVGLTMYGINPYWQGAITGAIIIGAIALDSIRLNKYE